MPSVFSFYPVETPDLSFFIVQKSRWGRVPALPFCIIKECGVRRSDLGVEGEDEAREGIHGLEAAPPVRVVDLPHHLHAFLLSEVTRQVIHSKSFTYRVTSLIRKRLPQGLYSRHMPWPLWWS